jgi:glycosyltransferase involved in cell wall biosynthesis
MKVLLSVKSLLPSYGGPAYSVSSLAMALAEAGVQVGLWTNDMSTKTTPLPLAHPLVEPLSGTIADAIVAFGQPNIFHDNGIWLPHNHRIASLATRRGLPRVVSTRGMLEPWAMNHKRLKKKVAWWLYQRRDLTRASCHHATAETEAATLRLLGLGVPVTVIPNGINGSDTAPPTRKHKKIRTALFLGRIHPVKGLSMLIAAWAKLRPQGWQLQIAGPDELGHRAELERQVTRAALTDTIFFQGPVGGEAKTRALLLADIFILPSYSESFAMAVGEALVHGVPVITTTGAPWAKTVEHGCGWVVEPTVEGITEGIQGATSLDSLALVKMGQKGREFVQREFAWPHMAKQFIALYEKLLLQNRRVDG